MRKPRDLTKERQQEQKRTGSTPGPAFYKMPTSQEAIPSVINTEDTPAQLASIDGTEDEALLIVPKGPLTEVDMDAPSLPPLASSPPTQEMKAVDAKLEEEVTPFLGPPGEVKPFSALFLESEHLSESALNADKKNGESREAPPPQFTSRKYSTSKAVPRLFVPPLDPLKEKQRET